MLEPVAFVTIVDSFVYAAKAKLVETTNILLVAGVVATVCGIIGFGATSPTLDLEALVAPANHHPVISY